MMEIERSFNVAEIRQVDLGMALGDLSVKAGGGDQLGLRARLRSDDESELVTIVADGVLIVKNRSDNGWLVRNANRIDVALTIPRDAAVVVTAKTGLGDVNVEGVPGLREVLTGKGDVSAVGGSSPLTIKTGKGDVAVRSWRGDLHVTTGKGDVAISDLTGGLQMITGAGDTAVERWQANGGGDHEIKTGSGDVALRDAQAQSLEVTTGRGDCVLRQVALRTLQAKTGYGNLTLEGDPLGGQWEVRTGKGDLALALSATAAARVEAATRHGSVRSELPQVKVARPGPVSQHGLRTIVVIGDEPRAEIRLETNKGDISVRVAGVPSTAVAVALERQPAAMGAETLYAVRVEQPVQPMLVAEKGSDKRSALTILESLSRGEISVDEAETLLRSLEQG
ncbi:MAG TPA: DUF4097 family beta strand repeat-containing protein [Anaerolineae bacterium]|nr:DUF4097 family beta strand repeat-containing protein [Anaerolineae bacterium]